MLFRLNSRRSKTNGILQNRSCKLKSSMQKNKQRWHCKNWKKCKPCQNSGQIRATASSNNTKSDNSKRKLKYFKRMVKNLRTQYEDCAKRNRSQRTLLIGVRKR